MFKPDLKPRPLCISILKDDYYTGDALIEFVNKLQAAIAEYGADHLTLSTSYENDNIELEAQRMETPAECIARVERDEVVWNSQVQYRLAQYKKLQEEFGDIPKL